MAGLLVAVARLPDVVRHHIGDYLPADALYAVCRDGHKNAQRCSIYRMRPARRDAYVRMVVRRDHWFVFERLLRDCGAVWAMRRRYGYRTSVYPSFLDFVNAYSLAHGAQRVRKTLLAECGGTLCAKRPKRPAARNAEWSN